MKSTDERIHLNFFPVAGICLEQTESIPPERMELIFGRDFKLEAADPDLFYAYELRKYSLEAEVIVCIGYGFGDQHINKILTQVLQGTKRGDCLQ